MTDVFENITLTDAATVRTDCGVYSSDQCSGGTPSASGYHSAPYEPQYAFDDNTTTRWSETDDSFPEWILYDSGAGVTPEIVKLRVYPFEDPGDNMLRLKDFQVQYSDDDIGCDDAGTFQCPNSGEQWYEFFWDSVGGHRYWRLYITTTWDGSSSSIYEIEMLECHDFFEIDAAESITLSDSPDVQPFEQFLTVDVSDAISVSDSSAIEMKYLEVDVSDTISLSESSRLLTEGIISDDFELADYIDAFNLTDTLTEGLTLGDAIDREFEAFRDIQDDFELSDVIDAFNWTKWVRDNADRAVKVYYLTVTGAADSTTDVEIPMESFQARKRSGYQTYLSVVVPFEYASQLTDRSNGQIVVDMAYKIGSEISLREEIVRADIDDIRIDEGSRRGSISIFGYRTDTFASQAVGVPDPVYRNVTDGKLRYRFAAPDPYLNPGDVATVGSDQFTVDSISYVVSARQQSMEIAEA